MITCRHRGVCAASLTTFARRRRRRWWRRRWWRQLLAGGGDGLGRHPPPGRPRPGPPLRPPPLPRLGPQLARRGAAASLASAPVIGLPRRRRRRCRHRQPRRRGCQGAVGLGQLEGLRRAATALRRRGAWRDQGRLGGGGVERLGHGSGRRRVRGARQELPHRIRTRRSRYSPGQTVTNACPERRRQCCW